MPKNNQYQVEKPKNDEKKKTHPVWRGIGCILLFIIPLLSYLGASILIDNRDKLTWVIIPQEIVANKMQDSLFFVKIVYAIILAAIIFLLLAIVTFVLNRFFGPQKSPYDVRR